MRTNKPLGILAAILGAAVLAIAAVLIFFIPDSRETKTEKESATETVVAGMEDITVPSQEQTTAAVLDNTPPVIEGVGELMVHVGEAVAYKKNVTVTDDTDPNPVLTVDTAYVDTNTIGEYFVIYHAEDASGNKSSAVATLKVVAQEIVTVDQANALADEILSQILRADMDEYEVLDTIYWFIHKIGYTDKDYAEVDQYLDNAYYFYRTRQGNCRCFYALTRLLLERLGYQTMRVQNSDQAYIVHYWNMVSADEGKTWYHYDPTCWEWAEDGEICMVTDAWLWSYSERHDHCYNWDRNIYPSTPEEEYEHGIIQNLNDYLQGAYDYADYYEDNYDYEWPEYDEDYEPVGRDPAAEIAETEESDEQAAEDAERLEGSDTETGETGDFSEEDTAEEDPEADTAVQDESPPEGEETSGD